MKKSNFSFLWRWALRLFKVVTFVSNFITISKVLIQYGPIILVLLEDTL
jgi:hypothetical protein